MTLFCIAEGNPWPIVSWHKDGILLQNARDSVLSLSKATPEMSGSYTCVASNGGSSDISSTALVRVQGKHTFLFFASYNCFIYFIYKQKVHFNF